MENFLNQEIYVIDKSRPDAFKTTVEKFLNYYKPTTQELNYGEFTATVDGKEIKAYSLIKFLQQISDQTDNKYLIFNSKNDAASYVASLVMKLTEL